MQALKKFFGRLFFVALFIILQVLWFAFFIYLLGDRYTVFAGFIRAASLLTVIWIVNTRGEPTFKIGWVIILLALPVTGYAVYIFFARNPAGKRFAKNYALVEEKMRPYLTEKEEYRRRIVAEDPHIAKQSYYLTNNGLAPVYMNTDTEYFSSGEQMYARMLEELEKAQHFIFLEYFIIGHGQMWDTILDLLEKKAAQGVDVRIIYDDVGTLATLNANYHKKIRERGIACYVFNPFKSQVSGFYQNRDHRKILVIDGHTGFTGGINLADEYINQEVRFGYWKDTGIYLHGEAVWSMTVSFLKMWSLVSGDETSLEEAKHYSPAYYEKDPEVQFGGIGYVQPYIDSPLDDETVGENVYMNILDGAKQYVYICTPYLIIDQEMISTLTLAAKNGVDIRIILPGIPDKKLVYLTSRSYCAELMDAGIKVYRYKPGFLHAKSFVCDDEVATVGSVNMDYRSFYLHFENGVWMYRSRAVMQVKEDFERTLQDCEIMTKEECAPHGIIEIFLQSILKLLAPLL